MRETIKKIMAVFAIMMLMLNSSAMVLISAAVDAIENIIDESKINGIYEINLEKYVNYKMQDVEKGAGVLLQYNLKTGIEYTDGQESKPLNSTGVLLKFPKIEDSYPEKVEVEAISTKATNGSDEAKDWTYVYDEENGEIRIGAFNQENDNGEIYNQYEDGARDEYRVICYYGEGTYVDDNTNRKLEVTGILQLNIKNNDEEIKKKTEIKKEDIVKENISGLISTEVNTSDIYNGFIKSNANNNTDYKTNYTENLKINVSYKDNYDEAIIKTNNYVVKTEEKNKIKNEVEEETKDIIYTKSEINKNEILNKLGENGYLKLYDQDDELLGEVNKDTEANENGIVELQYEKEVTNLKIVMSRPEQLGNIEIKNERQIKENLREENVNKIQVKNDISLLKNEKETIKQMNEETQEEEEIEKEYQREIYSFESVDVEELKDSETKMDVSIDKTDWTNNVQNDVTFTATLVTNDIKYSLFKNPTITIKMPSEVEKVILGDVSVLYDGNLQIANTEVIEEDGCKVIKISLNGEQTQYTIDSLVNGANVIIPATVIVKKDVSSVDTQVKINYENEKDLSNNELVTDVHIYSIFNQLDVNNSKEVSIENESSKSNFENNKNIVEERDLSKDDIELNVKAYVGSKEISNGDVVYEEQIIKYEINVINKTNERLNGISVLGKVPDGTVYGSVDIGTYWEGKYDYVKDEELKEYNLEINSLEANQSLTKFYEVIVNDLDDNEKVKDIINEVEVKSKDKVICSKEIKNTVKNAEMVSYLKSYIGRDEKNSLHYWLYVKNLSDKTLKNVKVETDEFPKELIFKKSELTNMASTDNFGSFKDNKYTAEIESINPGEYVCIRILVNVGNFDDNINEFEEKLSFKANSVYISNENRRMVYPEYVTVVQTLDKEGEKVEPDTELTYKVSIKNESKIRTQINILDYLPKGVKGQKATFQKWIFPNDDLVTTYDLEQEANKEYEREETTINIGNTILDSSGNPLGDIYYQQLFIPAGRTLDIVFTAKTMDVSEPTVASNYMTVSGEYIHTKVSNTVSCTIVPKGWVDPDPDNPDPDNPNPDNPDPDNPDPDNPDPDNPDPDDPDPDNPNSDRYSISGEVWFDKDENGIRDRESNMSGITVKIYNADNNVILKDKNDEARVLSTDADGNYKFTDLTNGRYLVLFEFDTDNYDVTQYKVSGVDDSINSDVVLKNVSIDGIEKKVAITDIITINSSNVTNIDMGLIYKAKFDLRLDKYVSKIKVMNSNGTKEYNYDEGKITKVEIAAKQVNNTTVEIQYKMKITNEGTADGYVTEISDYLPDGLTLNDSNWKIKSNGTVYTNILSGAKIESGESKEILLNVTKKLTTDTVGKFVNSAEITGSLNTKNLKDIDSVEGNKDVNEDDYSDATVIISIKTGLVRNIIFTFFICLFVGVIIYLIYLKKVKIKNVFRIFMVVLVMSIFIQSAAVQAYLDITGWVDEENHTYPSWDEVDGVFVNRNVYFICMDNGSGMCHEHHHWYQQSTEKTDETTTEISRIEEYVKITKDDSGAKFTIEDGKYKIGPYKISWNYASEITITGKYVTNDGTTIKTHDISSSQMSITQSGMSEVIYFILPLQTIEVNNVNVKAVHKDGLQITYEHKWRYVWSPVSYDNHTTMTHDNLQRMKPKDGWDSEPIVEKYDTTDNVTMATKTWYGHSKIIKKDKDTGETLEGVKFKIEGGPANITSIGTTNSNGVINFEKLQPGEYTLTEIEVPSGYNLSLQPKPQQVTITNGRTTTVNIKNRLYGDLKIIKVDKETLDKINGVGFLIFKEDDSGNKNYIKTYSYKENEPADVKWTTDIDEAKCFYSGEIESGGDGYTGNVSGTTGTVLLKNLPIREGSETEIEYYAQEYRFDYNKNPDLIYYKLDKSKVMSTTLVTNASGKSMNDNDRLAVMKRVTKKFYKTDYIRKLMKDESEGDLVTKIYTVIMGTGNITNREEKNELIDLLGSSTSDGYNADNIGKVINQIFKNNKNNNVLKNRAKYIFKNGNADTGAEDKKREYVDDLCNSTGGDIKSATREYIFHSLRCQTVVLMKNKQYTIDVRGYVWEDIQVSKQTKRNDLYKNDDADIKDLPASDVTVRLYAELNQNGGLPTLVATTDEDGNYKFKGAQFVLDANGNKVLDENGDPKIQYNIIIENLQNYNIEFEYNGLKYECVKTEKELFPNKQNAYEMENSSKAKEIENESVNLRKDFNNFYATITGDNSLDTSKSETTGKVFGTDTTLTYESKAHVSTLVQNTSYSVESADKKVNPKESVSMRADTNTAGCSFKDMYDLLPSGAREISNVNLGLYEREQPDLAIVTDIDNIKLSINGYKHTYNYRQRNDYINDSSGFDVYVKNESTGKYKNLTYDRAVYDSYIAYTEENKNNDSRLRMFVTYRIAVKNESSGLISKVSLRNYADARYERVSNSYIYNKDDSTDTNNRVTWDIPNPNGTILVNETETKIWETEIIDENIAPGECMYVYLTYEVSTDTIVEMATLQPNGGTNIPIGKNVTEIKAYQTYKILEDGLMHTYAGIDKDSAPNNIKCGNTDTYEDDTDAAPDLFLMRKNSKEISGLVFEDKTAEKLQTGKERLGNGKYDEDSENPENTEKKVGNVEVKLVKYDMNKGLTTEDDYVNDNIVNLYILGANGADTKYAHTITESGGTYNFTGLVPGEYYIVYTYGKYNYTNKDLRITSKNGNKQTYIGSKSVTTQEYKSTIIDENTYRTLIDNDYNEIKNSNLWYRYEDSGNFEKSSAVDDENIRTNINKYLSVITYGNKTAYEGEEYNGKHQVMKSYTGIMDVAIEDSRDQTTEYGYDDMNANENGQIVNKAERNYQIKFGIVERPRQSLKVEKDIASVKLALANGQIIAEGKKEDIQAENVKYVVYPEGGPLKIEIDNEIIEGADLDINYRINVQNLSEVDYDNVNYYRYGAGKNNEYTTDLVTLTPAIADYVDEKLSVTYDIDKNNRKFKYYDATNDTKNIWQLLPTSGKEDKKLAGINISDSVFGHIKNRSNIVVKKTTDEILPKVTETTDNYKNYNLLAKKKLTSISTNTDNTFENYVELIEVCNSVGRFYGVDSDREHPDNNIWKYETPGNFDVTNKDNLTESDTNSEINPSKVTIMPPTGDNKIYYYIIGISSLVILVGGIIIIKKKVL